MKMLTIFIRKPWDKQQIITDTKTMIQKFQAEPEEVEIDKTIELPKKEFADFQNDLLYERDFLEGQSGNVLVKAKGTANQSGIIVQTSGFNYARYAGLPIQKVDTHKCPRCGKYYLGHPAISRKDNKTEICTHCGIEEALLMAGFSSSFLNLVDQLQETADTWNVKIEVEAPKHENGKKTNQKVVIKPRNK